MKKGKKTVGGFMSFANRVEAGKACFVLTLNEELVDTPHKGEFVHKKIGNRYYIFRGDYPLKWTDQTTIFSRAFHGKSLVLDKLTKLMLFHAEGMFVNHRVN